MPVQGCPLEPDAQGFELFNLAQKGGFSELVELIEERLQDRMPEAQFDPEVEVFAA